MLSRIRYIVDLHATHAHESGLSLLTGIGDYSFVLNRATLYVRRLTSKLLKPLTAMPQGMPIPISDTRTSRKTHPYQPNR